MDIYGCFETQQYKDSPYRVCKLIRLNDGKLYWSPLPPYVCTFSSLEEARQYFGEIPFISRERQEFYDSSAFFWREGDIESES